MMARQVRFAFRIGAPATTIGCITVSFQLFRVLKAQGISLHVLGISVLDDLLMGLVIFELKQVVEADPASLLIKAG